jgi:AcrR family transcriptional regulator
MSAKEQKWIIAGYTRFALHGPKGLKIEQLAKMLNTSRSSFYHHFLDLDIFTNALFDYHLQRSEIMCEATMQCKSMNPDFINSILNFKEDVLFNKQLRINRHLYNYCSYIEKTHTPIERAFLNIWAKELNLLKNIGSAQMLLKLVVENFYMRISEENLNFQWLEHYLQEIVDMTKGIENN